jgi:nucleotide-binding universal stress UspA family protein
MKAILVINDNSPAALHAVEFACMLAQQHNADIILANTVAKRQKVAGKLSLSYNGEDFEEDEFTARVDNLQDLSTIILNFSERITQIDASDADECALAEIINRNKVWMMVKGTPATIKETDNKEQTKVHIVLNKIDCPLLLIPEQWSLNSIERITYISDLRYCEIDVIRYLTKLVKLTGTDLVFAHLTAKGLTQMSDECALSIFTESVSQDVKYDRLFFNNVKEKDFIAAIDEIVNRKENEAIAFVNHHFHIEDILSGCETQLCSAPVKLPVLIFPY